MGMLLLTRKPRQRIIIGDNIKIFVTNIRGDNVKIAIEAPDDIKIMREELIKRDAEKAKENVDDKLT